jgi:hypothetical protein
MSVNKRTKSILETITNTREHVHEEFGLMIQGEAQMTKSLIDTTRRGVEANTTEVEARAERVRGAGTGEGAGLHLEPCSGATSRR